MSENALVSDAKRDERGRFIVPPKSPGRPKGSRNKLGEAFLEALSDDFDANGADAIVRCRTEKPDVYVRVIAGLLPSEHTLNVNHTAELTDDELAERIRALATQLAPFLVAGTGDAETGDGRQDSPALASRVH